MARHLIIVLEGALAAFGAEMVDARGPVRDWPGASLLTGLLANALGWRGGRAQRVRADLEPELRRVTPHQPVNAVRRDRPLEPARAVVADRTE
jgi:hypothetical protein